MAPVIMWVVDTGMPNLDAVMITHSMADLLRERILAIACGYPDGNDLDAIHGSIERALA